MRERSHPTLGRLFLSRAGYSSPSGPTPALSYAVSSGLGLRNPARDAFGKLISAQLAAQRLQAIVRTPPLELSHPLLQRHVLSKRRQAAIQKRLLLMNPETFTQPERPRTSQAPSARVVGN